MSEYSATTHFSVIEEGINENTMFVQADTGINMAIGLYKKTEFSPEMVDAYGYLDISVQTISWSPRKS